MGRVEKHAETTPQNQMNISGQLNKYYHAILAEAFEKCPKISFREWKDDHGSGCLVFYRGEEPFGDYDCVASPKGTPFEQDTSLKTIFKNMNLNYGFDENGKISTTEITTKALCLHIEFITKILNENGVTLDSDDAEWERLKQQAGIY
ncbi:MAG: hypothetical protein ABXS91_10840 [Sulfurimonas sp.]